MPYFVANEEVSENDLLARTIEEFSEQNIIIYPNSTVNKVDSENKEVYYVSNNKQHSLSYDKLVVATGAKPIVPSFATVNNKNIFYSY